MIIQLQGPICARAAGDCITPKTRTLGSNLRNSQMSILDVQIAKFVQIILAVTARAFGKGACNIKSKKHYARSSAVMVVLGVSDSDVHAK